MRIIKTAQIRDAVKELAIKANINLRKDVLDALKRSIVLEKDKNARDRLRLIIENADIARRESMPICQDTGMAAVFCELGEDIKIPKDIKKVIAEGIRAGYKEGYLRKSVVSDPLLRKNTNTNTPPVIHFDIVKGDRMRLTVLPKGFGSENASRLFMLRPTDGEEEIVDYVLETVKDKGADACPPLVLGIGIGGTIDTVPILATKAILRRIGSRNKNRHVGALEKRILKRVNSTGIGPAGLGGKVTCIGVNILTYATHIAGLPLCVKVSCHATRSATKTI